MDLLIDFETYCDLPIDVGVTKYSRDPSMRPLSLHWIEFDPLTLTSGQSGRWTFYDNAAPDLSGYEKYWAANAFFDWSINSNSDQFGLPTDLNQWKDIFAVLAKFSIVQQVDAAAKILQCKYKKNPKGPLLISKCCKKNSKVPTKQDYLDLFDYGDDDIKAELEILRCLPSIQLDKSEWDLWRETCRMNLRGLDIDFEAVEAIKVRVDAFKEVALQMLPQVTNGAIKTPGQIQKIKDYLNKRGVPIPNVQAETLEALDLDSIPEDCKTLISIRMATGSSSVGKFNKLLEMRVGNKNHDFIRYGATNTLRWAGSGFQIHSLPKATVDDPEGLIQDFIDMEYIENPILSAKALCRAVVTAQAIRLLYQGDYSSIEYLLLIWSTDMYDMLNMFKEKKNAYIDMAAFLFNKKYEEIDKHATDNLEYFLGKQVILGCGYQMGAKKFRETCKKYGVEISLELAEKAVMKGYRVKYKPIVKMWADCYTAAILAVENVGTEYKAFKTSFRCAVDKKGVTWLAVKLASDSTLYYHSPKVRAGKYGKELEHIGQLKFSWVKRFLTPGRLVENIIQRLARDLIGYSILEVAKETDFHLLMQVHDELVVDGPEDNPDKNLERYLDILSRTPEWAKTIPLRAGGYYGRRYKKD